MDAQSAEAVAALWKQFSETCKALLAQADECQRQLAMAVYDGFGTQSRPYGERTIDELAGVIRCSSSYIYQLIHVWRFAGDWWTMHTGTPFSIVRACVCYDSDRAPELLDEWLSQGRPSVARWLEFLEEDTADDQDPLPALTRLLRRAVRANLDAAVASRVPLRGVRDSEINAIDRSCDFFVALRRRTRAILRWRSRRAAMPNPTAEQL